MAGNPATPGWGTGDYRIVCPVCIQQQFHVVDPTCLLCNGTGTLTLGRAALYLFEPEAVSLAITTAITDVLRTGDDDSLLNTILDLDTAGIITLDSSNT